MEADSSAVLDVLIVSEVRFLRDSLAEILNRVPTIQVRGQAASAPDALAAVEAMRPGILLLDVAFPGGPQTVAQLCAASPTINVIAIGVHETDESVLAWVEAGVVGYVPNTASVDELVSLIGQISRGEQSCPSHIAGSLLRRVAAAGRGVTPTASPFSASLPLTCREQQVFNLVGTGLSNKDIARRLSISLGTTKSHVHNLLAKLSVQRRADVMARLHADHHGPPPI